jgi:poly-beta-1,6-N-acetyl-D-glucosamine synthase
MKTMPLISLTMFVWGLNGFMRWIYEKKYPFILRGEIGSADISKYAAVIAAHNEEVSLGKTIESLKQDLPANQIFIVSDGSTDQTTMIAQAAGCHVLDLNPGQGKARALEILLESDRIYDRYEYVLLADADTIFPRGYVARVINVLKNNLDISVVTSYGSSTLPATKEPSWKMFYWTYRARLWRVLQFFVSYGETSRWLNVYPVIPGYASTYRTSILRQMQISVPGLMIEDFNLAFQMHKKRLGKIGFHPSIYAMSQDPDNWPDFWRQISRWNMGFWQTVFYWKIWPSWFWFFLIIYLFENLMITLFALTLPAILTWMILIAWPGGLGWSDPVGKAVLAVFLVGFVGLNLIDYILSAFVARKCRLPWMLWYGLGYWVIRYAEAVNLTMMIPKALVTKSSGRWISPTRQMKYKD